MTEKSPGFYSKLSREGLILMAGAYFALDFLGRAGVIPERKIPAQVEPSFANELLLQSETNSRLLEDLHSGIAPRDPNLIPQWSVVRQSMDSLNATMSRLSHSLDKNTQSNYYRWGDRPPHVREAEIEKSWLERLSDWFRWDAAG